MTNAIVTVNVSQTIAPTPNRLQQTGALISQGATNTAQGARTLLTQPSDLTGILKGALALSSLAWASSVVTATTAAPHGFTISDTIELTIAGATPSGYNGTFLCTITGASTFTYPLAGNPGAETIPGTYTPEDVSELVAMVTTFFAQGSSTAVYVVELGAGNAADGVTALAAYITANSSPQFFYAYLVPRAWSDESTFLTFLAGFESTTAKTYFYVTMTTGNYTGFTAAMKCVIGLIEAPGIPTTEFSLAAAFWVALHYNPTSTNKVSPFAFSFLFGVTAYPTVGNSALRQSLKTAGVNIVGSGAEGGISDTILLWGTTMDVRDFTYWYSVDWVQINIDLNISNAVINGSNLAANPLYYNQDGINRLQQVAVNTMASAVSFGLALGAVTQTELNSTEFTADLENGEFAGQVVVNAIPFVPYLQANPSDYKIGNYGGFAIVYTPARGFISIVFYVNVTDFVT